jgi:hypothetical protein
MTNFLGKLHLNLRILIIHWFFCKLSSSNFETYYKIQIISLITAFALLKWCIWLNRLHYYLSEVRESGLDIRSIIGTYCEKNSPKKPSLKKKCWAISEHTNRKVKWWIHSCWRIDFEEISLWGFSNRKFLSFYFICISIFTNAKYYSTHPSHYIISIF